MRVFTAYLSTETNTYVPIPTCTDDFTVFRPGPDGIARRVRPDGTAVSGPAANTSPHPCYDILRRRSAAEGFEVVEGLGATAPPSGTVRCDTYEAFRDEILDQLSAALPVDGVVLGLHGAMVAHGYDDVEGDLLSAVRALVGTDAVIGAEFDPHMHLTQRRFDSADILIAFKEFPHVDVIERAEEVVDLTLRTIRGEISPVMAKWDARLVEVLPTGTQPMRGFIDRLMSMEAHSEGSTLTELPPERLRSSSLIKADERGGIVLSISCIHGFMAADVESLGAAIVVITDGDENRAAALSEQLGQQLFEMRGKTRPQYWAPDEGVVEAQRHGQIGSPAVIADVWDNPGGGPAGDGTVILCSLMAQKVPRVGFSTIWDPQAVSLCQAAGEGSRLQLRFGGKTSHMAGDPIDALVTVEALTDYCHFSSNNGDRRINVGAAALVVLPTETGGARVIIASKRQQVVNPDVWESFGIDWRTEFEIMVVKSTNHFFGGFASIASELVYVDTGLIGLSPYPNDPTKTKYTKLTRPVWPRDPDPHNSGALTVPWNAVAEEVVVEEATLARL